MEVAALILSIIAIVVSMVEIYYNARLNKTNLKSEYFSKIYDEYLFDRIPSATNLIQIIDGRFIGFEVLQEAVIDMVSDLEFFKFADEEFYENIKYECMGLEDYLLETANKKNIQLSAPLNGVNEKIKKIYGCINKKRERG